VKGMNEKQFVKQFEKRVKDTIENYKLINKRDRVMVACSGGKDSTTMLYLLKKFGYRIEAIFIDLHLGNYSKKNLKNVKLFCKKNNVKLHKFSFRGEFGCSVCYMKSVLKSKNIVMNSCNICGVLRRWLLNKKARELKATKLVTGHNLDDEVETIFMNFFSGNINLSLRLGPITGVIEDEKFVPRVKPLYFCTNEEVAKYSKLMQFPVLYEKCPCSVDAYRGNYRRFINEIEEKHPGTKLKIVTNFLRIIPELREFYKTDKRLSIVKFVGNLLVVMCAMFVLCLKN
jgi:uncharacterized protein (TIGR00269 family)